MCQNISPFGRDTVSVGRNNICIDQSGVFVSQHDSSVGWAGKNLTPGDPRTMEMDRNLCIY